MKIKRGWSKLIAVLFILTGLGAPVYAQLSASDLAKMGSDATRVGDYDGAARFYLKALSTLDKIETKAGGEICLQLAIVYQAAGKLDQAKRYAGIAVEILTGTTLERSAKSLYKKLGGKANEAAPALVVQPDEKRSIRTAGEQQSVRKNDSPEQPAEEKTTSPVDEEKVYMAVEQMPEIIGGMQSLYKDLVYPESARLAGVEGRVFIVFTVDEQGNVVDPEVLKGIGAECDQAALEAVKNAKFKPGMMDGKPVKVKYSIPITFQLK